ncbi:colicin V production family protein [Collimonas arenae]|uniref:Colicin V production family protein n=1 Tax=Collimonas arenae TaxID=279058 RepID=A0A127PRN0_9BURK|nr:CvpA family protein [Collimonas arenae]AMP00389.1 colicin V production family protein [Collimonas arenae]AMP10267.1 colicin V production family protein [Collimonas arenae]
MTIFDYLVLFVLICSVVISTLRGLVKEILSLASWVIALVIANAYGENLAELLPDAIPGHVARLIVAFLALFIGVRLLMMLLSMALNAVIKASGLGVVDHGLGVMFGLARGLVIVLAAVLVCGATAIPQQPFWRDAMLSPLAETAARTVIPYLPGEFASHLKF